MADAKLIKPEAGQQVERKSQADERVVFDFDVTQATFTRSGDNLVVTFEDGANLVLTDFYVAYTADNMPEFVIGGEIVAGKDFFEAFDDENLMPAAGAGPSAPQSGGTTVGAIDISLLDGGVNSLDGVNSSILIAVGGPEGNDAPLGTNQPPVISGLTFSGVAIEGGVGFDPTRPNAEYAGTRFISGQINATDAEQGNLVFTLNGNGVGTFGTFRLEADGTFSYTVDNTDQDTQALNVGDLGLERFSGTLSDGTNTVPFTIALSVVGTNDRPEIFINSGDEVLYVTEDDEDKNTDTGIVTASDVDDTNLTFVVSTAEEHDIVNGTDNVSGHDDERIDHLTDTVIDAWGTFSVNQNGEIDFKLNNDYDGVKALSDGQVEKISYTVYVKDPQGSWSAKDVVVEITGTNDEPVINLEDKIITLKTDDSHIPDGNKSTDNDEVTTNKAEGSIAFSSVEDMIGGTITLTNSEGKSFDYTVGFEDGKYTLTPVDEKASGEYGKIISVILTGPALDEDGAAIGDFTFTFTYKQTEPYTDHHNPDKTNETSQEPADTFGVNIRDGKSTNAAGDEIKDTSTDNNAEIEIKIKDDAPIADVVVKKNFEINDLIAFDNPEGIETDSTASVANVIDFSKAFKTDHKYGADEEHETKPLVTKYTLGLKGDEDKIDSGLTSNGHKINLVENENGEIVGQITYKDDNGDKQTETIFTVSVDVTTGKVSLVQSQPIDHPNGEGSDTDQQISMDKNLITITRKDIITDADGDKDKDSETINFGKTLVFYDDESISISNVEFTDGKTLYESAIGEEPAIISGTVKLDFGADGMFDSKGKDGTDRNDSFTEAFKWNMSDEGVPLNVNGQPISLTTSDGGPITWKQEFDAVNGEVILKGTAEDGQLVITMTMNAPAEDSTMSTFDIELHQAIKHVAPDGKEGGADEIRNIKLGFTIMDGDGDTKEGSIAFQVEDDEPTAVVVLNTDFDEPTLITNDAYINPDDVHTDSFNFSDAFSSTHDFGADGPEGKSDEKGKEKSEVDATVTAYSLGIKLPEDSDEGFVDSGLTSNGYEILLSKNDAGEIVGQIAYTDESGDKQTETIFTVSVNEDTAQVTLTQNGPIDHNKDAGNDTTASLSDVITLTRTDTITDDDGDKSEDDATIGLNLTFKDDVNKPSIIEPVTFGESGYILKESDTDGSVKPTISGTVSFDFGPDGMFDATTGLNSTTGEYDTNRYDSFTEAFKWNMSDEGVPLNVNGQPISLTTSDGGPITWKQEFDAVNGEVILKGTAEDGQLVITMTMNAPAEDSTMSTFDIELHQAIKHVAPDGKEGGADEIRNIKLGFTIMDGDGDTKEGSIAFQVEDDEPTAVVVLNTDFDEPTLMTNDAYINPDNVNTDSFNFSDAFSSTHDFGADGPEGKSEADATVTVYSLGIKLPEDSDEGFVDSGLTSNGYEILLSKNDAGEIVGQIAYTDESGDEQTETIFTVSVDEDTAQVTLTQNGPIDHNKDAGNDTTASLSDVITLTRTDTITDDDGDKSEDDATIGLNLTFKDNNTPKMESVSFDGKDNTLEESATNIADGTADKITGTLKFEVGADGMFDSTTGTGDTNRFDSFTEAFTWLNKDDVPFNKDGKAILLQTSDGGPITWTQEFDAVNGKVILKGTAEDGQPVITATMGTPINGSAEFTIELHQAIKHVEPNDAITADDVRIVNLGFNLTDGDGDSTSTYGEPTSSYISFNIKDHEPTVADDIRGAGSADIIYEEEAKGSITGNVLENDNSGADGWVAGGGLVDLEFVSTTTVPTEGSSLGTGSDITWTKQDPADDGYDFKFTSDKGILNMVADGDYKFTYTDDSLNEGETITFNFKYTAKDKDGDEKEANLSFTVTGQNDAPTLAINLVTDENVREDYDANSTVTGSLKVTDPDTDGDELTEQLISVKLVDSIDDKGDKTYVTDDAGTVKGASEDNAADASSVVLEGKYGTLTIEANGNFEYKLYTEADGDKYNALNAMAKGEKATEIFEITTTDKHGASDTQNLEIIVSGSNDQPTAEIQSTDTNLKDDGVNVNNTNNPNTAHPGDLEASGTITLSDDDTTDTLALLVGDVTVTSGTEYYVSFAGELTEKVVGEDAPSDYAGIIIFTKNADDPASTVNSDAYDYNFALNAGSKTITELGEGVALDAINLKIFAQDTSKETTNDPNLARGDEPRESVEQTLTLNIVGTNDRPTLSFVGGVNVNKTTQEDTAAVTWQMKFSDVDTNDVVELRIAGGYITNFDEGIAPEDGSNTVYGTYGVLTVAGDTVTYTQATQPDGTVFDVATGKYIYPEGYSGGKDDSALERYNALQALNVSKDGDKENFTIYAVDKAGAWRAENISVTVKGVNDAPIIDEDLSDLKRTVHDDGVGKELISEPTDPNDLTGVNVTTVGVGDNKDFAGKLNVTGQIKAADIDSTTLTYSVEATGWNEFTGTMPAGYDKAITNDYGTLYLNSSTGKYRFELNETSDAVNALPEGVQHNLKFKFTVTDDGGGSDSVDVEVVVTGTNDKPTIELASGSQDMTFYDYGYGRNKDGSLSEDPNLRYIDDTQVYTLDGKLDIKDVDTGAVLSYTVVQKNDDDSVNTVTPTSTENDGIITITDEYGTFTFNTKTSEFDFTAKRGTGNAINKLGQDDNANRVYTLTVVDDKGASETYDFNVDILGTNDIPVVTMQQATLTEAGFDADGDAIGTATASGTIVYTDPDTGDTHTLKSGDLEITADGSTKYAIIADGDGTKLVEYVAADDATYLATVIFTQGNGKFEHTVTLKDDNTVINALGAAENLTLPSVVVVDKHGLASASHSLGVINGSNDKPYFGDNNVMEIESYDANVATQKPVTGQITFTSPEDMIGGIIDIESYQYRVGWDADAGKYTLTEVEAGVGNHIDNFGYIYPSTLTGPDPNADGEAIGSFTLTVVYTQTAVEKHDLGADRALIAELGLKIQDGKEGADVLTAGATIKVYANDDEPTAKDVGVEIDENGMITDGDVFALTGADGKLVSDGADGGAISAVTAPSDDWEGGLNEDTGIWTFTNKVTDDIFTMAKDGKFTFVSHDDSLNVDNDPVYKFGYTIKDVDHDESTASLAITVNGANDAPEWVIAPGAGYELTNDKLTVGKTVVIEASDVDTGDVITYGVGSTTDTISTSKFFEGTYGAVTISYDKDDDEWKYRYELSAAGKALLIRDGLDSVTESFKIFASDGNGGVIEKEVTVTLKDPASSSVSDLNSLTPDDSGEIKSQIIVEDSAELIGKTLKFGSSNNQIYLTETSRTLAKASAENSEVHTKINTAGGADIVDIHTTKSAMYATTGNNTGLEATNTINTGDGNDIVSLTSDTAGAAMYAHGEGAVNTLDVGNQLNTVTITGTGNADALYASNNGENIIKSGRDGDTIDIKGGIVAAAGGSNTIETWQGTDKVTIKGNISADGADSENIIDLGAADDFLLVDGAFSATNGGTNTILAGSGDDFVKLTAANINFKDVLVDGQDGMDVLLLGVKDLDAIKNAGDQINGMEIIAYGDKANDTLKDATSLNDLEQYGIKEENDTIILESYWTKGNDVKIGNVDYTEYKNQDDMTILVNQTVLNTTGN